MSDGFLRLSQEKLNAAVARFLCPQLERVLIERAPGHCMRVADLDDMVMESLCRELRQQHPDANVFILVGQEEGSRGHQITSTKLIELRNPEPDGSLRAPLMVFIPSTLRTSAEDSFGIATFEELSFRDIYVGLIRQLLEQVPAALAGYVRSIFELLADLGWSLADDVSKVRFLLNSLENGIDGETLGASMYELALIPDFRLFEEVSSITRKVRKNVSVVQDLLISPKSIRGRIAALGLRDSNIKNTLVSLFEQFSIHEPERWTSQIATDKNWWPVSFDKWTFEEEQALDKVGVTVLSTDLPVVQDDEQDSQLAELIGQQVLIPNERRKFNVVFEINPHPTTVNGLDHFTVQIVSQTDGPIGKTKKAKAWKAKRNQCTVGLTTLNKVDFEEGWHYVRVLPWTSEGDPIPLSGDTSSDSSADRPYESEPFYVLPGGTLEEEPPQRAIPYEKSVGHAYFRLQLTAVGDERDPEDTNVTSVAWTESKTSKSRSRQEILLAKFGREGAVQIPVSRTLKVIEQRILATPSHPAGWRMQINVDQPESPTEVSLPLPASTTMRSFLAAREDYFAAVRQAPAELISQGVSFGQLDNVVQTYADSYLDLVRGVARQAETTSGAERQGHLQALRSVLAVDSVHVIVSDFRGKHREAVLIAPTHPLKALWFVCWSRLGASWIHTLKESSREHIAGVRAALLESMQASAFPVCVPVDDGRIFTPVDDVTPFWGLYAPATEDNARGLLAEVCSALGLMEPTTAGSDISGTLLADKIERYLAQHPYVRELALNVFNPGSGVIIGEALVALQENTNYSDLRYDIRLFSADPDSPVLGEQLQDIVRPGGLGNEAGDAFTASTGSHLFTKMRLAKYSLREFDASPSSFPAHISVMLDVFPAEELSAAPPPNTSAPLYGLLQDYHSEFVDDETGTYWHRAPVVRAETTPSSGELQFQLLTALAKGICFASTAVATSGSSFNSVPLTTLGLDVKHRQLIYDVHKASDWVFTVDRHMGIEFFDHGGKKDRPDYLIDYVPGTSSHLSHNLIISSRSTDELEAMVQPVLAAHGLAANRSQAAEILSHLRSLSGQLALKLISANTQQTEALGLALARLYLEYQGALGNQIIVPLDAHTDLYRTLSEEGDSEDEISLRRTDLALFDLDFERRTLTCNLVEVKCHQIAAFSAFNQLKEQVSAQISQSERIIQRHFDPALRQPDRPDRPVKTRQLVDLLRFYLERSIRYGIFENNAAREANALLDSLDQGYSLQFRRCGLIFDFDKDGTEAPDNEVGIEFHRIGKDIVSALLLGATQEGRTSDVSKTTTTLDEQDIPGVPKCDTAAFKAPDRPRTISTVNLNEDVPSGSEREKADQPLWQSDASSPHPISSTQADDKPCIVQDEVEVSPDGSVQDSFPGDNEQSAIIRPSEERRETDLLTSHAASVSHDVLLGATPGSISPQYGLLGEVSGRKVALDLNHTHTISLFGVQGGGKSYTLGSIIEMASMPIPGLNVLPSPLATVVFHYSPTEDYAPEFTSMNLPNQEEVQVRILRERYGVEPRPLSDIVLLTPADKVAKRTAELAPIEVRPIAFSASELKASHWKFLMGAVGSQSMYMRQINLLMRGLRDNLTLERLRDAVEKSGLSDHLRDLALTRLQFAGTYIDDSQCLGDLLRPGRLLIVDLRDEFIEKDEALGLFMVILQILSEVTNGGVSFNKLVVFDEAHKYIENDDMVAGLVEVVREMRHKGTSILVASQDPPSVPISLIELSSQIIMHKFNSPAWLKHIQKANTALSELTSDKMSHLGAGEAYVWSSKSTDEAFSRGAVKILCRPRVTRHGGGTKTAVVVT